MTPRAHALIHAPAEGPGAITPWLASQSIPLREWHVYRDGILPGPDEVDWLIVMGGPMNIYQHRDCPWLPAEKDLLRALVGRDAALLGICLGSQLLADAVGGRVVQNRRVEIGWFPVQFAPDAPPSLRGFGQECRVFHWHGDTFELPAGLVPCASSAACRAQAFALGDRIIGLQFHPEVRPEDVRAFLPDLPQGGGESVQSAPAIAGERSAYPAMHAALHHLLEAQLAGWRRGRAGQRSGA